MVFYHCFSLFFLTITIGFVIVMDPVDHANYQLIDGITLTGLQMKLDAIIYVAPGNLSLLQCTQVRFLAFFLALILHLTFISSILATKKVPK